MKTDPHFYALFRTCPRLFYDLTGLPFPGPCRMQSVAVKAVERRLDGLITPRKKSAPLIVAEFQIWPDALIYVRAAHEVTVVQLQHPARRVDGVIIFAHRRLDPKTEPWRKVVRALYLDELLADLAKSRPGHVLLSVFKPLMEKDETRLEKEMKIHYQRISRCALPEPHRKVLLGVFSDWLVQRFKHLKPSQFRAMMIDPTPIEKTPIGRELISIGFAKGKAKGEARGRAALLMELIQAKFGRAGAALAEQAATLRESAMRELGVALIKMKRIDELKAWMAAHAAP